MLKINAETRDIEIRLLRTEKAVSDFTPFWDILIDNVLVRWFNETFDSEGFGEWDERKDNLPHPLLQLTGALRKSLTKPGSSNNINQQRLDSLEFGSDLFYHIYHEEGTSKMVDRPIIGLALRRPHFERDIEREVEQYFQNIVDGGIR